MTACWQVEAIHVRSNLEASGATGTVGNVCLDIKNSEVRCTSQPHVRVCLGVVRSDGSNDYTRRMVSIGTPGAWHEWGSTHRTQTNPKL